jgi:hypothetical protein
MAKGTGAGVEAGWAAIDRERQLDRWVRWICGVAWGVTLCLAGCYAVLIVRQVVEALRRQQVGAGTGEAVLAAAMPLVLALGILAVLVAALSTVGVFLRFRTAALSEIQLRLATLETLISQKGP